MFTEEQLHRIIDQVAEKINRAYAGQEILLLTVLNGAFIFAADLLRRLTIPADITFLRVSSYKGQVQSHTVNITMGFEKHIENKHVLIIEDIIDTGRTLHHILPYIRSFNPASISVCALFFKPDTCTTDIKIDYLGIEIENDFIIGYGLDDDGFGRQLKDIYRFIKQ